MHKSSKCLEKYAGVILFRPEYAGVSSGVEKIAPDFCRSKKIYSGRNSVWSPLVITTGVTFLSHQWFLPSCRIGTAYVNSCTLFIVVLSSICQTKRK